MSVGTGFSKRLGILEGHLGALGWSIGNAVAPRRMRARHDREIAMVYRSCDLALYGLSPTWFGERRPGGMTGHRSIRRVGPLGLRRRMAPFVAGSIGLSHLASDGSRLTVTSHRAIALGSLKPWLADSLFRAIEFKALSALPDAAGPEEFELAIDRRRRGLASGRMAWTPAAIPVDGRPQVFEVLRVEDAWVGVATIQGTVVTIHAERFGVDALRLVRITEFDQYIGVP